MSEFRSQATIPADTLAIGRKVRTGSRANIEHSIAAAITASSLEGVPMTDIQAMRKFSVDLIRPDEYLARKVGHPVLGIWSPLKLADAFNDEVKERKESAHDYMEGAELSMVDYEELDEGIFIVGFAFSEDFKTRIMHDRTDVIDTLLDVSRTSLTDPIRQWRNEGHDDLWLPVVTMRSTDPLGEHRVQEFSQALEESTASMVVDLYDAKAKHVFVNVPVPV